MAADPRPASFVPTESPRTRSYARVLLRTPGLPLAVLYLAGLSLALGGLGFGVSDPLRLIEGTLAVFFLPALVAGALTPGLAGILGGKLSRNRSFLLALIALALAVPFLLFWRIFVVGGVALPALPWVVLTACAPALWFRHLSLFGVSNPAHLPTLPVSLLQPLLALVGLFLLVPPTLPLFVGAAVVLAIALLSAMLLLRAADRPLRREFDTSGVKLIRPLLDHVSTRDPLATEQLEEFFGRHAIEADLRAMVLAFRAGGRSVATLAMPTVHPGPFAAVGASDLPRKVEEALGSEAGTVFVPHTPCNHDLDLPSEHELGRVLTALGALTPRLARSADGRLSPLVSPRPGSLARAQLLGDVALVVISQAPNPSDDIDFAVVDGLSDAAFGSERPVLAFIDAHNSYRDDEGDLTYGSPAHKQLREDIRAAVEEALRSARPGPLKVGVSVRKGYSVPQHGIGPSGIRALVVETPGRRTGYVLIDGNNLLLGFREKLLAALAGIVDDAEILTTDNHVVHEVDGGVNPVGERYGSDRLSKDVRAVVAEAASRCAPVELFHGRTEIPAVRVLGPAWTARLLTALSDTVSVFANAALTTFLLMVTSSLVVVAILQ